MLGWADWRAIESNYGLGLITAGLHQAMAEGILTPQPLDVLAHLILSAIIEAALLIALRAARRARAFPAVASRSLLVRPTRA